MAEERASPDGYWDIEICAEYLSMSVNTLRKYVREKRLPFIRPPGTRLVRFRKEDLDSWMLKGLTDMDSGGKNGKAENS